jgi:hypothetical protein
MNLTIHINVLKAGKDRQEKKRTPRESFHDFVVVENISQIFNNNSRWGLSHDRN